MIAKLSAYPDSTGTDLALVFLVVVCVLAALFVLDWMRNG